MERLQPLAGDFSLLEPDAQGRQRLNFHLNDGASLRDAISAANESVVIAGLNESIASMNDIFIRAVKEDSGNPA